MNEYKPRNIWELIRCNEKTSPKNCNSDAPPTNSGDSDPRMDCHEVRDAAGSESFIPNDDQNLKKNPLDDKKLPLPLPDLKSLRKKWQGLRSGLSHRMDKSSLSSVRMKGDEGKETTNHVSANYKHSLLDASLTREAEPQKLGNHKWTSSTKELDWMSESDSDSESNLHIDLGDEIKSDNDDDDDDDDDDIKVRQAISVSPASKHQEKGKPSECLSMDLASTHSTVLSKEISSESKGLSYETKSYQTDVGKPPDLKEKLLPIYPETKFDSPLDLSSEKSTVMQEFDETSGNCVLPVEMPLDLSTHKRQKNICSSVVQPSSKVASPVKRDNFMPSLRQRGSIFPKPAHTSSDNLRGLQSNWGLSGDSQKIHSPLSSLPPRRDPLVKTSRNILSACGSTVKISPLQSNIQTTNGSSKEVSLVVPSANVKTHNPVQPFSSHRSKSHKYSRCTNQKQGTKFSNHSAKLAKSSVLPDRDQCNEQPQKVTAEKSLPVDSLVNKAYSSPEQCPSQIPGDAADSMVAANICTNSDSSRKGQLLTTTNDAAKIMPTPALSSGTIYLAKKSTTKLPKWKKTEKKKKKEKRDKTRKISPLLHSTVDGDDSNCYKEPHSTIPESGTQELLESGLTLPITSAASALTDTDCRKLITNTTHCLSSGTVTLPSVTEASMTLASPLTQVNTLGPNTPLLLQNTDAFPGFLPTAILIPARGIPCIVPQLSVLSGSSANVSSTMNSTPSVPIVTSSKITHDTTKNPIESTLPIEGEENDREFSLVGNSNPGIITEKSNKSEMSNTSTRLKPKSCSTGDRAIKPKSLTKESSKNIEKNINKKSKRTLCAKDNALVKKPIDKSLNLLPKPMQSKASKGKTFLKPHLAKLTPVSSSDDDEDDDFLPPTFTGKNTSMTPKKISLEELPLLFKKLSPSLAKFPRASRMRKSGVNLRITGGRIITIDKDSPVESTSKSMQPEVNVTGKSAGTNENSKQTSCASERLPYDKLIEKCRRDAALLNQRRSRPLRCESVIKQNAAGDLLMPSLSPSKYKHERMRRRSNWIKRSKQTTRVDVDFDQLQLHSNIDNVSAFLPTLDMDLTPFSWNISSTKNAVHRLLVKSFNLKISGNVSSFKDVSSSLFYRSLFLKHSNVGDKFSEVITGSMPEKGLRIPTLVDKDPFRHGWKRDILESKKQMRMPPSLIYIPREQDKPILPNHPAYRPFTISDDPDEVYPIPTICSKEKLLLTVRKRDSESSDTKQIEEWEVSSDAETIPAMNSPPHLSPCVSPLGLVLRKSTPSPRAQVLLKQERKNPSPKNVLKLVNNSKPPALDSMSPVPPPVNSVPGQSFTENSTCITTLPQEQTDAPILKSQENFSRVKSSSNNSPSMEFRGSKTCKALGANKSPERKKAITGKKSSLKSKLSPSKKTFEKSSSPQKSRKPVKLFMTTKKRRLSKDVLNNPSNATQAKSMSTGDNMRTENESKQTVDSSDDNLSKAKSPRKAGKIKTEMKKKKKKKEEPPKKKTKLLKELQSSEGFVADKLKKHDNLFETPERLNREERALQRALMQFTMMEMKSTKRLEQSEDVNSKQSILQSSPDSSFDGNADDKNSQKNGSHSASHRDKEFTQQTKTVNIEGKISTKFAVKKTKDEMNLACRERKIESDTDTPNKKSKRWSKKKFIGQSGQSTSGKHKAKLLTKSALKRYFQGQKDKARTTSSFVDFKPVILPSRTRHNTSFSSDECLSPPMREKSRTNHVTSSEEYLSSPIKKKSHTETNLISSSDECISPPIRQQNSNTKLPSRSPSKHLFGSSPNTEKRSWKYVRGKRKWVTPQTSDETTISAEGTPRKRTNSMSSNGSVVTAASADNSGLPPPPPELQAVVSKLSLCRKLGETALHRAARLGYQDVVLWLIQTGKIDVNARDHVGYTALHEACANNHVGIVKHLLANGADPDIGSTDGVRPLHEAVENDDLEMVRLFLAWGADAELSTYSGDTVTSLAESKEMTTFLKDNLNESKKAGQSESMHSLILANMSSASLSPDDDIKFFISDHPQPQSYRLKIDKDDGYKLFLILNDVLTQLGVTKESLLKKEPTCHIYTLSMREFLKQIRQSQVVYKCIKGIETDDLIDVIEYSELVRRLLGEEECVLSKTKLTGYCAERCDNNINDSDPSVFERTAITPVSSDGNRYISWDEMDTELDKEFDKSFESIPEFSIDVKPRTGKIWRPVGEEDLRVFTVGSKECSSPVKNEGHIAKKKLFPSIKQRNELKERCGDKAFSKAVSFHSHAEVPGHSTNNFEHLPESYTAFSSVHSTTTTGLSANTLMAPSDPLLRSPVPHPSFISPHPYLSTSNQLPTEPRFRHMLFTNPVKPTYPHVSSPKPLTTHPGFPHILPSTSLPSHPPVFSNPVLDSNRLMMPFSSDIYSSPHPYCNPRSEHMTSRPWPLHGHYPCEPIQNVAHQVDIPNVGQYTSSQKFSHATRMQGEHKALRNPFASQSSQPALNQEQANHPTYPQY